jgi:hypothetical protein
MTVAEDRQERKGTASGPRKPVLEAWMRLVQEHVPFFLDEDTYHRFKVYGLTRQELQHTLDALAEHGLIELRPDYNGVYVHPAQATAHTN